MLSSGEGPFLAALRREAAGARAEKIVADDGTFKPDDDQDVKAFDLIFSLVRYLFGALLAYRGLRFVI